MRRHGAPVSVFTVAKELGHGGEAMVRKVSVVEYRVGQHRTKLGYQLGVLQAGRLGTTLTPRR